MTSTIHVIATSVRGTQAALTAAIPTAIRQDARVVLLVPQTTAPAPERQRFSAMSPIAPFEEIVASLPHPVQIRLCMAPNPGAAVARLIPGDAKVYLGGPVRVWWPSPEERLAASLRRSGREVVFVGCNSGTSASRPGGHAHA